jgi:hypothetical protein
MPEPVTVRLDVRNYPSEPPWHNVTSSNGQTYSYHYEGGSDGEGDVVFQGRGAETITIELECDPRYQISACTFTDNPDQQLSSPTPLPARAIVIQDANSKPMSDAYYSVTVTDTVATCTLPCDPYVSNS